MFPRKRVSSNNNSSKGESGTREERLPGLHQTHAKCEPSSRMLGKKTRLRPRVQGASPCLGRRGPGAQQAGPGAQRCPCSESLFPAGIGEHRAGRHPQEAGSSAGATAGTAGRQDRAAQQPAPGARGQQGQPSGLDPGPATRPPAWVPAQNTQGGCALAPRLAPTSPRLGTLQLGGRAGRAREFPGRPGAKRGGRLSPRSVSPAPPVGLPGLRRLHGPCTQAVPGRLGVRSASSTRSPGRDRHSPRPPRLRAADPRRSLLPGLAVPCGRARPRAVRTGGLGPARPPPAPRSPSPPEFGALLQCLRG